MFTKSVRGAAVTVGGALLLLSVGCAVAVDMLNPELFTALGFDPATIFPSRGTIIVSFTNNSSSSALFYAYTIKDSANPANGSRNFSVEVEARGRRNEVLTCPIDILSLGSLGADFAVDPLAVQVLATGGVAEVNYAGAQLATGTDFNCGDVVDVQLYERGATGDQNATYSLSVRVIPGR